MDRYSADLDRQLGAWLREESATRAPERLVEEVFARTSRTRQARRWWPSGSLVRPGEPHLALRLAVAAIAVVAVTAFAVTGLLQDHDVGATPSPTLTPVPSPTLAPLPSPQATSLDGSPATVLRIGIDAGPIDVAEAFESIWIANINSNEVVRLDPTTLQPIARIPAGTGPAWFAVTDNALWVTNQTGQGLAPINPATNLAGSPFGAATPCGAPVLAFNSIWASACDSNVIIRMDTAALADIVAGRRFPSNDQFISEVIAPGYRWLAFADGRLFTGNAAGLAEVDPTTETVTDLGFCCGDVMGSDGQTIWLNRTTDVVRMDPADGRVVATFPYANAGSVTFAGGRAWLTVSGAGVIEVDLASNDVVRTIPVPGSTLVAREAAGFLWVTAFDTSELWRIEP